MVWQIGINPLTWTNDDLPSLGGDTPLETCLAEARLAGYAGIELGNKFPRDAAVLAPILARHDLRLVSGWYSARLRERDALREIAALAAHRDLLKAMGCPVVVFAETSGSVHGERATPLSRRPVMTDEEWPSFALRLAEVGRHLAEHGLKLAYHHHMGTVIETEAEIDRLMGLTGPEVGLLLDTGHLTYAGGDPLALARRHAGRIVHVHCKDVRPDVLGRAWAADLPFLEAVLAGVFTVPGDGAVDYGGLLAILRDTGYAGWLVVEAEQDPAVAHPLTYARLGHANLTRLMT